MKTIWLNISGQKQLTQHVRPILDKITYKIFKGRKLNISYFHQFGCTCYILYYKVYIKKFDVKLKDESF